MQAAKQVEREYERQARENRWAEPDTVTFEETAEEGIFEVYAEDSVGDLHLLGFEDLREESLKSVDEMLKDRGLRQEEITEMHREEMRRQTGQMEDEESWRTLERIEMETPGFDGYVHDGQRLVFTGRRNRAMGRIPAGISPGAMDEHDKRRLKQEVEMRMGTPESELVAVMGQNCVVIDTRFDIDGRIGDRYMRGAHETLNVPIDELQSMGVDPTEVFVIDQQNAKTLFIAEGDYYYRGSLSETNSDPYADGWVAALDQPVESVNEVLNEAVRPDSVIAAEDAGLDVKRQGDWFFIEQHDDFMPTGIVRNPELQPEGECDFLQNHAAEWLGMDALNPQRVFVKGEVTHLNDDHETMDLGDEWFTAQHNGVESRSFECEEFDATTQDRGMYSHPESHGGLL